MIKIVCLLFGIIACSFAFDCITNEEYDWPDSTNCRYYHHCKDGKATDHSCLVLLKKFNPEKLKCDWAWKVNCEAVPQKLEPKKETSAARETSKSSKTK
uniref:Secreted Chitin-binding peritrophin-like protein n=1 Tax=Pristhesancus plagipennis TaxID=1955184 RepID=A0A2K8JM49_PRIPG|nr:secreted Chitin-binding peritrophin-like protein [Pristhesancus plagipennis]